MPVVVVEVEPTSALVGSATNPAAPALLGQDGVEVFGRDAVTGQVVGGYLGAVGRVVCGAGRGALGSVGGTVSGSAFPAPRDAAVTVVPATVIRV